MYVNRFSIYLIVELKSKLDFLIAITYPTYFPRATLFFLSMSISIKRQRIKIWVLNKRMRRIGQICRKVERVLILRS